MNRQNIIFVSLLLITATAIVAVGYATGRGPLAVISGGVSQITSGGQMIPSRSVTEEAWPTLFLLDKQGRVRWTHVGEGYYDETEQVIQKL